jgi:cell division protein FtsB
MIALVRQIPLRLYEWRRRIATAAVLALTCMVAFHVIFGANGMMVYQQKRAEHKRLQQEIQTLQQENEALDHNIKSLKTDPKTIEKEAREQLRYARPGEVVYTLPKPAPAAQTVPATAKK